MSPINSILDQMIYNYNFSVGLQGSSQTDQFSSLIFYPRHTHSMYIQPHQMTCLLSQNITMCSGLCAFVHDVPLGLSDSCLFLIILASPGRNLPRLSLFLPQIFNLSLQLVQHSSWLCNVTATNYDIALSCLHQTSAQKLDLIHL